MMSVEQDVIIDVGVHKGEDSFFYALQGYSVVGIEANPELFNAVRDKAQKFGTSVEMHNVAISDTEGSVDFFVNEAVSSWSSVHASLGNRSGTAHKISVPSRPLGDVLAPYKERIAYVKIDIEGMDTVALSQLLSGGVRAPYVSVENGTMEQLEELISAGYDSFKYVNQSRVEFQKLTGKANHSDNFEHRFLRGSSGLWGNDTPGAWMDVPTARKTCESMQQARKLWQGESFAALAGWFDLHARLPSDEVPQQRHVKPQLNPLGDDPRFAQDVRGFVYFQNTILRNRSCEPIYLTQFSALQFDSCGADEHGPYLNWHNSQLGAVQKWRFGQQYIHASSVAVT